MRIGPLKELEFQGLRITATAESESNIAAIIGRNGSGKTRLLNAIVQGRVPVFVNGAVVPQDRILLLTLNELQPTLVFDFDPLLHLKQQQQAVELYRARIGRFRSDWRRSYAAVGPTGLPNHLTEVGTAQLAHVVSRASRVLGKDVNDLSDEDIADFWSEAELMHMGSLNVTSTMQAYLKQKENNDFYEFRNEKYGEQHPYRSPEEFRLRFGPPPWEMFNEFLRTVLDGRYHINVPTDKCITSYCAKLHRTEDNLETHPTWLSSGEKVLMWLCLSMYAANAGRVIDPPKLLLLDEPDGALHPQMIQKLHMVLRDIASSFDSGIIFTTHSPTTVALFDAGPVWQVSERELLEIAKDAAIADLLGWSGSSCDSLFKVQASIC